MARGDFGGHPLERPGGATPISDAIRRHLRTRDFIRSELIARQSMGEACELGLRPADSSSRFL
jgi:hypothetical protein